MMSNFRVNPAGRPNEPGKTQPRAAGRPAGYAERWADGHQ